MVLKTLKIRFKNATPLPGKMSISFSIICCKHFSLESLWAKETVPALSKLFLTRHDVVREKMVQEIFTFVESSMRRPILLS